jgi:hypothetical protein
MSNSNLVAQLNERWRIIDDGKQWVLARLDDRWGWVARTHCRTRAALERCAGLYAGDVDPGARAILAALPGHIDWGDPKPAPGNRKKTTHKPSLTSGHDGGS